MAYFSKLQKNLTNYIRKYIIISKLIEYTTIPYWLKPSKKIRRDTTNLEEPSAKH